MFDKSTQTDETLFPDFFTATNNNIPAKCILELAAFMKYQWIRILQLLLILVKVFTAAIQTSVDYANHITYFDRIYLKNRLSILDNITEILGDPPTNILPSAFPNSNLIDNLLSKREKPFYGYLEKKSQNDEFMHDETAVMLDKSQTDLPHSKLRKDFEFSLDEPADLRMRKFKSVNRLRGGCLTFDEALDPTKMNQFCSLLANKKAIDKIENYTSNTINFQFRGQLSLFREERGIIFSILRMIKVKTNFTVDAYHLIEPIDMSASVCSSEIKILYTFLYSLLKAGCLNFLSAKLALFDKWTNEQDSEIFSLMYKKLENRRSTQQEVLNFENIHIFKNENMCKAIIGSGPTYVYFANSILSRIQTEEFDSLFVDGTYIKGVKKYQLIIVRMHSSKTNSIINACYVLSQRKTEEEYKLIFNTLSPFGFLKNIVHVMTDFELALRNSLFSIFGDRMTFHFCFYHLLNATRNYASSINRASLRIKCSSEKVSPYCYYFFSYLMFVKPAEVKTYFKLLVTIFRAFKVTAANEAFFDYFKSTFITGPYAKHLYTNLLTFQFVTNNTVEGVNSGLKRFIAGRNTIKSLLKWIPFNAKCNILQTPKLAVIKSVDEYRAFQDALKGNKNWLLLIVKRIKDLGNNSKLLSEKKNELLHFINSIENIKVTDNNFTFNVNQTVFNQDYFKAPSKKLLIYKDKNEKICIQNQVKLK